MAGEGDPNGGQGSGHNEENNVQRNLNIVNAILGSIEPFQPDKSWLSYLERIEFFFEANNIVTEARNKATLLTSIGEKAYEIVRSLATPKTPKELSYAEIIKLLTEHFNPTPNEIVQRFTFNRRVQKPNEKIAVFVADLRRLSEHCNFAELDKMLRDRIVCGIKDESVQKRMFAESDLTLKKAYDMAIAAEIASNSVHEVRATHGPSNITSHVTASEEVLAVSHSHRGTNKQGKSTQNLAQNCDNQLTNPCFRCTQSHDSSQCKFAHAICAYCKKKGHILKACFKLNKKEGATGHGQMNAVQDPDSENPGDFTMFTTSTQKVVRKFWWTSQSTTTPFKWR